MRKITYLMMLMFFVATVFAQNQMSFKTGLNKTRADYKLNSKASSKSLTAEISQINGYVAGTTMKLNFNFLLNTPDFEYGDLLEITFPAGMVPITGQDPIATATENQDPEVLIGVTGQKITWGDNDNNYGGIEPGEFTFWIEVAIDANVEGKQTVEFYLSGDMYGAAPNEFSGSFTVKPLATTPDLAIQPVGFINDYFAVPFDQIKAFSQVTSTLQALVSNTGTDLTEATKVSVKTDGSFVSEIDLPVPLNGGAETQIVFSDFAAPAIGEYTFTYTANASNDADPENGVTMKSILVNETDLIRDNGEVVSGFGIGSGGGDYMGTILTVNNKDTLNSVTAYLITPTLGDILTMNVFRVNEDGTPGDKIAESIELVIVEQDKEFNFYFAGTGVILEPGNYLFAIKEDVNNMSIAVTSTPYVFGASWVFFDGQWMEISTAGFPFIFYIRPGFGTELPDFDVALLDLNLYKYELVGEEIVIEGTLLNKGVTPLTTIDISYTVNGGTPVKETIAGLNVNGLYEFSLATSLELSTVGDYEIVVTISNANGAPDADVTNDAMEVMVSAIEYAPVKSILGEEATGTWCGWCVRGHVYMDYMEEHYAENWIGVAVHNNDPMEVSVYDSGIGAYIAGYPSGLVNRMGEYDPSQFEDAYTMMIDLPSPVDMAISNVKLVDKLLTFDVNAKFLATLNDARFNAVIVENGVTGSTTGYNQANYYSGGGSGAMGGYENLPNPVLAEDMVYQNVARAILGGWDGTASSIPAQVVSGDVETYTYSIELSADWNTEELVIIGMVIGDDGSVLNSKKTTLANQVNLTFKVDMSDFKGLTTSDKVYVSGNFGMLEMTSTDGVNFEATVAVSGNTDYNYSYMVNTNVVWSGLSVYVGTEDVTVTDVFVGLSDMTFANVQIYPNPVNGVLTITNASSVSEIVVSNLLGQEVLRVPVNNNTMRIDTQELNDGVYLITIRDNENLSKTMRIVKQ